MSMRQGKKGFVLALSAILLLSLSVIVAAFLFLVTTRARTAAAGLDSAKAFWLAEAGIQQAVFKLKNDVNYRTTPKDLDGSLGEGAYSVTVTASTTVPDNWSAVSTGTKDAVTRTITQTLSLRSVGWAGQFTNYGVFAGTGNSNITLRNAGTITGDAYAGGTVRTDNTSSVTGTVYATSGSGNYTRQPLPDPPITMPNITKKWYDGVMSTASTYPKSDATYTSLDLTGKILYVNGKVDITNVTGAGTIIAVGNCTVSGTVGTGVNIISNGSLSFGANSQVWPETLFYGRNSVEVMNAGIVMDKTAILSPGYINLAGGAKISGVLFAQGNISLSAGAVVTGSVAAGNNVTVDAAAVIQDTEQLPQKLPIGVIGKELSVLLSDWRES